MTDPSREPNDAAPLPAAASDSPLGPAVLIDAIIETRRVVAASALMWAVGYIGNVMRDLRGPKDPIEAFGHSLWSVLLHLLLAVLLVAIAVWAPRAAKALGLPKASNYWAAWVPCMNPFVVAVLAWRLFQVLREFGVDRSLLLARRERLENEL